MYTVYEVKGLHDGGYVGVFETQEQALEFCRNNMRKHLVIGECSTHQAKIIQQTINDKQTKNKQQDYGKHEKGKI